MKIKNNLIRSACLLTVFALCAGCAEQTVETGEITAQSAVTEGTVQVNPTVEQTERQFSTERETESATLSATEARKIAAVSSTPAKQAAAGAATAARQSTLLKNFQAAEKIRGYYFLKSSDVDSLAKNIADDSRIYFVRLNDGTKTYYMAVDLTTAKALSLANRSVLTRVCRELDSRQQAQAGGDFVLMDYTHLVGELELHFLGYLLTGALGAENGPLARFYRSCACGRFKH